MRRKVKLVHNGVTILRGDEVVAPWVFWTGVEVSDSADLNLITDNLEVVKGQIGAHHYERGYRCFYFPPIFELEDDE